MKNTLVYLVYGPAREYQLELTLSVLSAVRMLGDDRGDVDILLVTTADSRRDDLPVEHMEITAADLNEWTFGGTFKHAAKIGALIAVCERYGGKVALVDTDTYFRASPLALFDRIADGRVVLHDREYRLADHPATFAPLIGQSFPHFAKPIQIDDASVMYNTGVVGVTAAMVDDLRDALAMTERLASIDPNIHTLEQFSTGFVLSDRYEVALCSDVVRHYFGFGRHFVHCQAEERFPTFDRQHFAQGVADWQEPYDFPPKRVVDQVRARLKRLRTGDPTYAFAYLSLLSAFGAKRADHRNAWANAAVDVLRWNTFPRDRVARDFRRLGPTRLAGLPWLAPQTRTLWAKYWDAAA